MREFLTYTPKEGGRKVDIHGSMMLHMSTLYLYFNQIKYTLRTLPIQRGKRIF